MSKEFQKNQKDKHNSQPIEYGPEYNNMSQEERERLGRLLYASKGAKTWMPTLNDGETKRLRFVFDERTRYDEKRYSPDNPAEKPAMKQFFYVLDLDDPEEVQFGEAREFLMSKTQCGDILNYLMLGYRDMEITRHGDDKKTWYEVKIIKAATASAAAN